MNDPFLAADATPTFPGVKAARLVEIQPYALARPGALFAASRKRPIIPLQRL